MAPGSIAPLAGPWKSRPGARVDYPPIDFQDLHYYAAPKKTAGPKSLDEVDPALLETYKKLGIPLKEQENPGPASRRAIGWSPSTRCSTVSSVVTTFKAELAKHGRHFSARFPKR